MFDQGIFLTWPDEIFLTRKGKKLKILVFLGEIFQTQNQTKDDWPELSRKKISLGKCETQVKGTVAKKSTL